MYHCSRPGCLITFNRVPSQVKKVKNLYCSRSCAASVNNKKYPKRIALVKKCKICNKEFVNNKDYCSRKCGDLGKIISREKIITLIQEFCFKNGRIPYKNEFSQAKAARLRFETWNKAVVAAGFRPNPVRFANKYIANDGHKCDSLAEKIIDDWLNFKKINHLKSPRYPNSRFTSDFKVGNTYIEFFGLANELDKYDRLKEEKLKMISENNYNLIKIYPKDIYPISNLDKVFTVFLPD